MSVQNTNDLPRADVARTNDGGYQIVPKIRERHPQKTAEEKELEVRKTEDGGWEVMQRNKEVR